MAKGSGRAGEALVVDQDQVDGADYSGRRLSRLVSIGSRFQSCQFRDLHVDEAAFGSGGARSEYLDCVFDGSRIRTATGDARFVGCSFRDIDLRNWDSSTVELVNCTFSGRMSDVIFYGHADKLAASYRGYEINEFHDNDFSGADLRDVEFRWGIDLSRQRLPVGSDYVYLADLPAAVANVRDEIAGWPDSNRKDAERTLGVFEREIGLGQIQMLLRLSEYRDNDMDAQVVEHLARYASRRSAVDKEPEVGN